ncbi:ribosome biogenesis GTPase Der [Acidobacteriota bacterium]
MKKYKKVAIVGFPNVGKSTLFNRLLKKKKSLVHDLPGMTRDQISSICELEEKKFTLIDTGGIFDSVEDPFSNLVKEKAWAASRDADLILFILDGKKGLLPAEEDLFQSLRKLDKPILLVVNKTDTDRDEERSSDFYRLGAEDIVFVSAEHKRNIQELRERIAGFIPQKVEEDDKEPCLNIAIVGRINVGKSSLINRLCGEDKLIVSEFPGTTRDSTDTLIQRNKKCYCLVDTAGIRKLGRTKDKREQAGIIKAKKDIIRADVICMILDAEEFPTRQDTAIAHIAKESGKPLVLILNKWDLIEKDTMTPEAFKKRAYAKLDFISYAPLLFVSAVSGQRVIRIFDMAEEVFEKGQAHVPTSKLNELLGWMNSHHPPVSRKKQRIKIKYMTQTGILPLTFSLFTHSQGFLAPAYEKFFINTLRETFGLEGTPIRIKLRRN